MLKECLRFSSYSEIRFNNDNIFGCQSKKQKPIIAQGSKSKVTNDKVKIAILWTQLVQINSN